ncbi:MAG: VIT domain-containing protein [Massilia sp.]
MTSEAAELFSDTPDSRPRHTITFIGFFGVFMPLVALAIEASLHVFQWTFLNPIPTLAHAIMIALVPLANGVLLWALARGRPSLPTWFAWLQGVAMGTSLLYAILFLPATPIGAMLIIAFGVGFLLLAPLMSFIATMLARRLWTRTHGRALPHMWRGMALALLLFIAFDTPATLTRIGLQMASSATPETRTRGVLWLRRIGNDAYLLQHCQQRSGETSGVFGALFDLVSPVTPEQASQVYYRVTGNTAVSQALPTVRGWRNVWDRDRGGEVVGQRLNGVTLDSSRMDGSVDGAAALAYVEWTMVFKNSSSMQQEARGEIQLPAGAVVSRATLWINGEEREAAFGGRGAVRAAYEKVVRQSRDPLLVTTAGRDRVLVQLFPIQSGGEMKIRIGMTVPLSLPDLQHASMQLPAFSERNFEIAPSMRHAVWMESASPLASGKALRSEQVSAKLYALRGDVPDPVSGQAMPGLSVVRAQDSGDTWTPDEKGEADQAIVQRLGMRAVTPPRRLAIVIDGSVGMQGAREQLLGVVGVLPDGVEVSWVFAGDDRPQLVPQERGNALAATQYLQALDFAGGRDNSAALASAWDWAAGTPDGAIVWIHGPQPDLDSTTEALEQRFARRPGQVTLYDLDALAGPNTIARRLDGLTRMERVARGANLGEDLRQLFAQWAPGAQRIVVTRERQAIAGLDPARKTSSHLARLWAATQVAKASVDPKQHAAAVEMATRYQLVTPVSGAVVLETKQQFDEAGLEPVAPGSVPTVPEPETWMLLIVALAVLGFGLRRRRA